MKKPTTKKGRSSKGRARPLGAGRKGYGRVPVSYRLNKGLVALIKKQPKPGHYVEEAVFEKLKSQNIITDYQSVESFIQDNL